MFDDILSSSAKQCFSVFASSFMGAHNSLRAVNSYLFTTANSVPGEAHNRNLNKQGRLHPNQSVNRCWRAGGHPRKEAGEAKSPSPSESKTRRMKLEIPDLKQSEVATQSHYLRASDKSPPETKNPTRSPLNDSPNETRRGFLRRFPRDLHESSSACKILRALSLCVFSRIEPDRTNCLSVLLMMRSMP